MPSCGSAESDTLSRRGCLCVIGCVRTGGTDTLGAMGGMTGRGAQLQRAMSNTPPKSLTLHLPLFSDVFTDAHPFPAGVGVSNPHPAVWLSALGR